MDKYQDVRNIALKSVLASLGFTDHRKRSGKQEWYGRCPFHDAKKNKTSFSFDERRFNCFSCGEHGSGSIDLVMKLKKIGFQEAVKELGGVNGASASYNDETGHAKTQAVANSGAPGEIGSGERNVLENKPFAGTYEKFYVKSEWLKARGLTEETLNLYGVGQYVNPSRKSAYTGKILFRIQRFSDGAKVGYLARTIQSDSPDPKYIFPKGFHKQLEVFGAWQLKQSGQALPLRVGFVVESPLCVMKYHQLGLPAVSPFGAFLSSEQVEIVAQLFRGVIYLPDRDKQGQVENCVALLSRHLWVKSPEMPEGIDDPENLSSEQILALVKS